MDSDRIAVLRPLFAGTCPPGLYRLASRVHARTLLGATAAEGWAGFYLDGHAIQDKAGFLQGMAAAMHFPDYFGHNWDALDECITDLAWVKPAGGFVLLYDQVQQLATHDPAAWSTARTILSDAVDHWRPSPTPFYVLLRQSGWHARDLPWLA